MAWFSDFKDDDWKDLSYDEFENQGLYSNSNEAFMDELNDEDIDILLAAGNFTDVYGTEFSATESNSDPFVNFTEDGKKANILGLPLHYCKTADPGGRRFKDTIMQDIPYVFIVPGKPVLNGKLIDSEGKKIKKSNILKKIEAIEDGKYAVRGARSECDLRFLGFRSDYYDYYKYVETLLSAVHATMGLGGIFKFNEVFDTSSKNYGLCYYCDKSTSISESADNDYAESSLVQSANDISATSREIKTVLGINSNIKDYESKDVNSMVESMTGSGGIISRIGSAFGRVVNGSQLLYPDIWTDSKFNKSYTLSFKFYSPYGDKKSIFKNVYVPFISLLALSLPRQDSTLGYGQPFVLRLCKPGMFESSMGVVTSMTFTKGGTDNLWNIDGLPQEIEVQLNIKDLYPTMAMTKRTGMLSYNLGLASFLDTMAGIRMDQLNTVLRGKAFIKTRLTAKNKTFNSDFLSDCGYNIQQKISNILK